MFQIIAPFSFEHIVSQKNSGNDFWIVNTVPAWHSVPLKALILRQISEIIRSQYFVCYAVFPNSYRDVWHILQHLSFGLLRNLHETD